MIIPEALYIHIPFCVSKCKYCDFYSIACGKKNIPESYLNALCKEIEYRVKKNSVKSLKTIYIGGGTPSLLSEIQISELLEFIYSLFDKTKIEEITIEVNPDDLSESLLNFYWNIGVTRISCGIQSMTEKVLKFCSRRADSATNENALELLKKWKGVLSVDLICGLPGESEKSFIQTLEKVVSINPHHISMYSLTIEEETPFGKMLQQNLMNYDFDFSDTLWLKGRNWLFEHGYTQYEVSNFCRGNFVCKHNLYYWNHCSYIGCGSGGTGSVYNDDGTGLRWTNIPEIEKYNDFWNNLTPFNEILVPQSVENIDLESSIFEFFMMGLRKTAGVNKSWFEKCFNLSIPANILEKFADWQKKKKCIITETDNDINYSLGKDGILFLNSFLERII